ncbi:hypothetical protein ACIQNU_38950 [Streptomyces sp. NPDC091292]|uniref:hypothetical protein n=1 Tax=Streptomyces sp. NPDC091292 TaxID=3365991 RepID=UPI0037F777F6
MSWNVPEMIKLTMNHQMEVKQEPGLVRTRARETTAVVRRPARGEARMVLECKQCGREGVFVVQDLETTKGLRRGPVIRSLIASVVLVGVVVAFWLIGLVGDSILFTVLAIPASLLLLPIGIALAVSPSSNIGVKAPEFVAFGSDTAREGLSYVTRNKRRGEGVSCSGRAEAAG